MLPRVVHPAADVAQLIERREVLAYEQRLARLAYAYGVDLRRSAWLAASTLGDPIMRAVDRGWNALVADLSGSILHDASRSAPLPVMEELAGLVRLLRAPLPTLRVLVRGIASSSWPIVTPLGTTKGAIHWLVIDAERLMALPTHERTFLLGAALGDLQCDHGSIVAAHLMSYRSDRGLGLVRALLRPWSNVGVFSADRAGLIACNQLDATLAAMRAHATDEVPWMPKRPSIALREQALHDFDRSAVMVRVRLLMQRQPEFTLRSLRRKRGNAAELASDGEAQADGDTVAAGDEANADGTDRVGEADASVREGADPYRKEGRTQKAVEPDDDEELARALVGAWSLARCDQRLTRRLGLL
jgi:hypothetical protein